jgi:hypothetical protein
VVLAAVALLAVDEAAVRWLRRREDGNTWSWRWMLLIGLTGFVAVFLIVLGLLLPAFKMASTVQQGSGGPKLAQRSGERPARGS